MRRESADETMDHQRCLSLHSSFARECSTCSLLPGSGSYSLVCPRPCSSHLSVGQVYHPPPKVLSCPLWPCVRGTMHHGRRNWAVPGASMGNSIGHFFSTTTCWRFFNSRVARVLGTALPPRIFVLPRYPLFLLSAPPSPSLPPPPAPRPEFTEMAGPFLRVPNPLYRVPYSPFSCSQSPISCSVDPCFVFRTSVSCSKKGRGF